MQQFDFEPVLTKLRDTVYPSVDGYWRADAAITAYLDNFRPNQTRLISCGTAALGAFFSSDRVATVTADIESSWINRRMMEGCLKKLGVDFLKHQGRIPPQGLVLLQRVSRRPKKSYRGSFLTDTHWVAVVDDYVFDVNWPQWLPNKHWKSLVGNPLAAAHGAESWEIVTGYEILLRSGGGQQKGIERLSVDSHASISEEKFPFN